MRKRPSITAILLFRQWKTPDRYRCAGIYCIFRMAIPVLRGAFVRHFIKISSWRLLLCVQLWAIVQPMLIMIYLRRDLTVRFPVVLTTAGSQIPALDFLVFTDLQLWDLREKGCSPSPFPAIILYATGEIYGFRSLKKKLETKGYTFKSDSDCEILLPLYEEYGTDMFRMLDAEYALVLFDGNTHSYLAARDPIGIRPLYYGYDKKGAIVFASEPKNLIGIADHILPFPPGHYYKDGKFVCYRDMTKVPSVCLDDTETVCRNIHDKLTEGIRKRLDSDAPLGFLLSGGLDSSLVCAISARILDRPIRTFAIGMSEDAIDLKYAKEVADHIGSEHTEIIITKEDVISSLPDVIQALGTFDITTIRASVGMYLICKAIHETTDIRVLMTGEISDELFGYKYTDFCPFQRGLSGGVRKE